MFIPGDASFITRVLVFVMQAQRAPQQEQQQQPASAATGAANTGVHWLAAVSGLEAVQPPTAPMAVGHTA